MGGYRGEILMDKSTISEEFGEHLASVTAGTLYDTSLDEDDLYISELEHRIRKVMYSLWMDAQSKKLADEMERNMKAYFDDLYEFSYGITFYDETEHGVPRKTDTLALMIIDEKETYKKQIKGARHRYKRFEEICNQLSIMNRQMFISYFERIEKVNYKSLRNAIFHHLSPIESRYAHDARVAEARTKEISDAIEGEAPKVKDRKRKPTKSKKKYVIPGIGQVTEEEWEADYQRRMAEYFGLVKTE